VNTVSFPVQLITYPVEKIKDSLPELISDLLPGRAAFRSVLLFNRISAEDWHHSSEFPSAGSITWISPG
jgi:hypothetical protein